MTGIPAARLGDPVVHTDAREGLLVGLAVGLLASVAIVAVVGTGGAALPAVIGGIAAATAGGGLLGESIGALIEGPVTGALVLGSLNVRINQLPAMMAVRGAADCSWHEPYTPIATGSTKVAINGFAAARVSDKLVCSAIIKSGSPNVMIGGPSGQFLPISPEVPVWVNVALMGVAFAGTVAAAGIGAAVLGVIGSTVGSSLGSAAAKAMGYGEKGQAVGGIIGGVIGGFAGGASGDRIENGCWFGHPVEAASGAVMTRQTDFMLPGPMPLRFERIYLSNSTIDSDCGHGWSHNLDLALWPGASGRSWTYRNEEGRLIAFASPAPGKPTLNVAEQLQLWTDGAIWWVTDFRGVRRDFGAPMTGGVRRLSRITNLNGDSITLERSGAALSAIVDSAGRRLAVTTDAQGRIVGIAGPHPTQPGESVALLRLTYDEAGDQTSSADALGHGFRYVYDNHLLVDETRPGGVVYHFRYDDPENGRAARCVETWGESRAGEGGGRDDLYRRSATYFVAERRTVVTVRDGAQEEYSWNRNHQVTQIVDAVGRRSTRIYDPFGRLTLEARADAAMRRLSFDEYGRVTSRQDYDGQSVGWGYDEVGEDGLITDRPVAVSLPGGGTTRYEWDARLNLVRMVDAAGRERRFLRDERGRTLAIQDALGVMRRFSWTGQGLLAGEADGSGGQRASIGHDALGRVSRVQLAGETATLYRRDAVGRIVEERRETGEAVSYDYDSEGNLALFRDPLGNETHWRYDGLPVPLERRAPDGTTLRYAYDGDLNLTRLTNEKGEIYELSYDAADQLVGERGFDGRRQRYRYDRAGYLSEYEDAGEIRTRFTRDKLGRLLEATHSDGAGAHYAYDPAGRLVGAGNEWGELAFAYDPTGLLLSESQGARALAHELDARGRRVATVLPDGRRIETGWGEANGFEEIRFDGRNVARFTRDVLGRETQRVSGEIVTRSEYDPQGRLTRQSGSRVHRAVLIERSYRYDAADQLRELDDLASGRVGFDYDVRGRLAGASGVAAEAFAFDPASNLLGEGGAAPGNRLQFRGDRHFTYDARGNRVGERRGAGGAVERSYVYDATNQLRALTERTRLGVLTARYAYDALGRRVSKTVERRPLVAANDGAADARVVASVETREFLWLGNVLLAEGPAGSVLESVYLHEPGSFRPLALVRGGAVHHYHLDHLGTPQEVTNDTGEIVWRARLKAWGGVARTLNAAIAQPIRFQGQYHDAESGLYYNRYRYYAPDEGCYVQQDPIGLAGGINTAAYVAAPTGWVDPFGLAGCGAGEATTDTEASISSRLPRDLAVNPKPPEPLPLNRPIGLSPTQNAAVQADIADAQAAGATDFRVNQQQVDAAGNRVGINRPDLQYTDASGQRVYVEYDTPSSGRGLGHQTRILANDAAGRVILKTVQ